ncbi:MAG: coproporphyrinogen dehydrogenase HemZ [Defluviitaleaceae bacterium]|nr:coproporphyrinogen dehydrogenase HemZ [Defluviitaleaceae bacterium]
MRCALRGHTHSSYIQTAAQLFFPNSRFSFSFEPEIKLLSEGFGVLSCYDESTGTCRCEAYVDGVKIAGAALNPGDFNNGTLAEAFLVPKRLLALSAFRALREATGAAPPWGALTGVRPAKLVREWLGGGFGEAEISSFLTGEIGCLAEKAALAIKTARREIELTQLTCSLAEPYKKTPLGLYVSVPFCPSRCLYCSFNEGHGYLGGEIVLNYLEALSTELERKSQTAVMQGGILTSVYVGGGTPTALEPRQLDKLLRIIENLKIPKIANMEYTVEAGRPDSITVEKLGILRGYGINRIAVNPQTLNAATLNIIGRNHTPGDFFRAYEMAAASFGCVNVDIIAGLPGETVGDFARTVKGVAEVGPTNVTVHALTVKRASRLNENLSDYPMSDSDAVVKMLDFAGETFSGLGLSPYYIYRQKNSVGNLENAGYSKPGNECLYNSGMMAETLTIIGAGAGAASKYVEGARIRREYNVKNVGLYIARQNGREADDISGA